LANLATIFRNDATGAQETDKLADLFRSRVELKKEFAALRNEKYRLLDRIKQQEGATARVQQQLQHLENLLLDPEWVHNVVIFYQLRALATHCQLQLSRFAEQLKQQRERRKHSRALASWNERRKQKSDQLESQIGEHRLTLQMLEDQLESERHRLMTMNGFAKLFRGRSVAAEVEDIAARINAGQRAENESQQELEVIQKLDPPDRQGLDVAAKRSINFMILSYAQQLYLQYEEDDLVGLAKEASEKSVGAINYGRKAECDDLLERLEKRRIQADKETDDLAKLLQKRAKLIGDHAKFRHDDDAVPVPATVSTLFAIDSGGGIERQDANLLGDNYFGIARVLSR
jgi:hypothetical protein